MSAGARLRHDAAAKYRPALIRLLLVAEAPPSALDRYFYFERVSVHDDLFLYVCKGLFGRKPERHEKAEFLARLRDEGVFLIDVSPEPLSGRPDVKQLTVFVAGLVDRCRALKPRCIILIKAPVYDVAYEPLAVAGLPVLNERIPFPGSGRQSEFEAAFARALKLVGI